MTFNDFLSFVLEKLSTKFEIWADEGDDFGLVFTGFIDEIPVKYLEMEIESISAPARNVISICL